MVVCRLRLTRSGGGRSAALAGKQQPYGRYLPITIHFVQTTFPPLFDLNMQRSALSILPCSLAAFFVFSLLFPDATCLVPCFSNSYARTTFFNIDDFGADYTGTNDSTAAIQDALNAAIK